MLNSFFFEGVLWLACLLRDDDALVFVAEVTRRTLAAASRGSSLV